MDAELKEILKGIKGFRDFYPEDYAEIKKILNIMHSVSLSFGYEEYEGPSVEYAKLIEYKSGQELAEETYRLYDREQRKLVLRPEQTPTLARLVVNQHQRYPKPLRWYCIPRIFRDETPQRGRVKEHFQYNADIIGIDHPAADAEIIAITTTIIKNAGLRDGEFVCVINSRALLQNYIEFLKIKNYLEVIKIIDAKGKYLQNAIESELREKGLPLAESKEISQQFRVIWQQDPELKKDYSKIKKNPVISQYLSKLLKIEEREVKLAFQEADLNSDQIEKLYSFSLIKGQPKAVISSLKVLEKNEKIKKAINNLEELIHYLELFGVENNCEFDMSIARGLDYYTGIVFEFLDKTGSVSRAIAGGGRYDQLVKNFGGGIIPATGIGMGETVLLSILKELGRVAPYTHPAKINVAAISEDVIKEAAKIASTLRKNFEIIFNPFGWNLTKQLEDASSRSIPLMVIIGKKELSEKKVTLRNLTTGEQKLVSETTLKEEILKALK